MNNNSLNPKILKKTANYCARAERSPAQVERLLQRLGVLPEHQAGYLQWLQEQNFVAPERFAEAFAKDRMKFYRWGPHKVVIALQQQHRIAAELSQHIVGQIVEQQENPNAILEQLLCSKQKQISHKTPFQQKQALIRYAVSKGFAPEQVFEVLDQIKALPHTDNK